MVRDFLNDFVTKDTGHNASQPIPNDTEIMAAVAKALGIVNNLITPPTPTPVATEPYKVKNLTKDGIADFKTI